MYHRGRHGYKSGGSKLPPPPCFLEVLVLEYRVCTLGRLGRHLVGRGLRTEVEAPVFLASTVLF